MVIEATKSNNDRRQPALYRRRPALHRRQPALSWRARQPSPSSTLQVPYTEEQLARHFRRFDVDGDGRLGWEELKHAFSGLGALFPRIRADLALLSADSNGDGYIDENELGALVKYATRCGYIAR